MNRMLLIAGLLWSSLGSAAVINVEFKFTPFVGDPATAEHVDTVAGKSRLYLNNVLLAEQPVRQEEAMVMFDEREVSPSLWLPMASAGPGLRKGKNTIRVEFDPDDATIEYRARLSWAAVNDESSEQSSPGGGSATNQSGEGRDEKTLKGKLVIEREFDADFASEQPWHQYPAVTALSEDDKKNLAALVAERSSVFAPDFAAMYALLEKNPQMQVARIQEAKCLDKVYEAGLRVSGPAAEQLDITLSGGPEVVLSRRGGEQLFMPVDPSVMEKITDEEVQMCAGFALFSALPPKLVAVRSPAGVWEVAD